MSAAALDVSGLAKAYRTGFLGRKVVAVRNVHISVQRGEVLGVVGPNGAGKSTTIKMLLGLVRPDAGGGTLLGQPLGARLARRSLGYLAELPVFPGHLSVHELLDFHARLVGVPSQGWTSTRDALVERVGLGRTRGVRLKAFSKGMLQRAGMAVALCGDPDLLVLDEPMSGLDPVGRHDMRELIRALRDAGKTVLFSTHVLADVEALCDRVCIIAQGATFRAAPLHEVLAEGAAAVDIRLRAVGEDLAARLASLGRVTAVGHEVLWRLDRPDAVNQALGMALAGGAQVVQVAPRAGALEDVLVRAARAADGEGRVSPA